MNKKWNKLNLLSSVLFGISSALSFADYTRLEAYETKLLRGAAAYVQHYDGRNPKEVLGYAKATLNIAGKNKKYQNQSLSDLEKELSEIHEKIEDSSIQGIYKPVLRSVGEKIEGVTDDRSWNLLIGLLYGVTSLAFFLVYKSEKQKDVHFEPARFNRLSLN